MAIYFLTFKKLCAILDSMVNQISRNTYPLDLKIPGIVGAFLNKEGHTFLLDTSIVFVVNKAFKAFHARSQLF